MVRDYGFDLPDIRYTFFDLKGEKVQVRIVRHWYQEDPEDDPTFKVSFDILRANDITHLPIGTDQSKAVDIAVMLYEPDREATESWHETERMYEAERRMGA